MKKVTVHGVSGGECGRTNCPKRYQPPAFLEHQILQFRFTPDLDVQKTPKHGLTRSQGLACKSLAHVSDQVGSVELPVRSISTIVKVIHHMSSARYRAIGRSIQPQNPLKAAPGQI